MEGTRLPLQSYGRKLFQLLETIREETMNGDHIMASSPRVMVMMMRVICRYIMTNKDYFNYTLFLSSFVSWLLSYLLIF